MGVGVSLPTGCLCWRCPHLAPRLPWASVSQIPLGPRGPAGRDHSLLVEDTGALGRPHLLRQEATGPGVCSVGPVASPGTWGVCACVCVCVHTCVHAAGSGCAPALPLHLPLFFCPFQRLVTVPAENRSRPRLGCGGGGRGGAPRSALVGRSVQLSLLGQQEGLSGQASPGPSRRCRPTGAGVGGRVFAGTQAALRCPGGGPPPCSALCSSGSGRGRLLRVFAPALPA